MTVSAEKSIRLSGLLAKSPKPEQSIRLAARTMAQLSHPERLRVLCHLVEEGELSVAQLLERIDLSPSALSQHLARMRDDGLIAARRASKSVFYTIRRDDIRDILALLHRLYCGADAEAQTDIHAPG